ncbi:MAG: undecaprenyldiphospho-muramoylpentapeptide beta-N-acetylglucosaminyltransferase [Myxococcales bacterium]|jgi:UDP-N-acetylglucosamine--N-acetylmuramyl-(pentapeptide) pyrophosphoryl-undecaprenol N-acetylglucosamine transferase|nr:undecaprenyldiphospho-muramoylpentapeptide beta-N-acetylglucosaminyltransferase [Myxococcales bacterium]
MSATLVLAGGGTGGHVYPMVAVAHALRRLRPDVRLVFVGTQRGMETRVVPEEGFELELLEVLPIRGGGLAGVVKGVARAALSLPESRALLRRLEARAVFSIGGYAAGPVSLAARTLGIPLALMEPNSIIGLANQLIAPFVQRAYTAFRITESRFAPAVVLATGVPLRDGFEPRPYPPRRGPLRILVLGGSQGAKTLNETIPAALSRVRSPLRVVHQCGRAHADAVRARYAELGVDFAEVVPFIDDMPAALADAQLVVSRSGAGAVSEICAVGRPSLLVPYPFAAGDHQWVNAEALQQGGAAVCLRAEAATVERLTATLEGMLEDPATLPRMAAAARRLGRPHAAETIARDFLDLAGLATSSTPGAGSPREQGGSGQQPEEMT